MTTKGIDKNVKNIPNSPTRGGLSSGSEDMEEEWASCEGELERGAASHCSTNPDDIQARSAFIQQIEMESRKESNFEPDPDSVLDNEITMVDSEASYKEQVDEIMELSQCSTKVKENKVSRQMMRTVSYQKAMTPKSSRPLSMPDDINYEHNEVNKELEEEEEEEIASSEIISKEGSPLPESKNGNLLNVESSSLLHPSSISINIPRSVSFNDRLLNSPKRTSIPDSNKSSSVETNRRGSANSPVTPSVPIRRQTSTPGRIQVISKTPSPSSSPDYNFVRGSISGESTGRRRSIKNLTTNLARRFSFRKYKAGQKAGEDNRNYEPQTLNGLPLEDGVVSYQSLLRLFECPGCHNLMVPPLLQCNKGHLICEKCRSLFKSTCPICKQRITGTTNYMMEQVCQLVKFPCQFGKFGCPEYHPHKQKGDHENFCVFRPVHCHFESRGCELVLSLKEMNAHIALCPFKDNHFKGVKP